MTAASKPTTRRAGVGLPWLRPVALVAVTGLHLGAVSYLTIPTRKLNSGENSIELTIAQGQPEPPPEPPAPPDPPPPPPEPTPPPPPPPPPPEPEPEPPPEPPKKVVEEAPALPPPPPPKPKPATPPKPQPPKPQPPQPDPPPQPAARPAEPPPGEVEALQAARAQAVLTYGQKFALEVGKHNRRSASSRKASVKVAYVIDAQGAVNHAEILISSGDDDKDRIALDAVRASNAGPPPFSPADGTVYVDFGR